MREILFRGKRIDNGEWIYGDLRHWRNGSVGIHRNDLSRTLPVDHETICQYTGQTDKNGKKIFEGDEVQAFLPATVAQREYAWPVMQVVFSRGAFGLSDGRGEVTSLRSFSPRVEFEIVGNTHDEQEGEQ